MGQGTIRHRENNDKVRPREEKNQINKKSNKSDINGEDKKTILTVSFARAFTVYQMTSINGLQANLSNYAAWSHINVTL